MTTKTNKVCKHGCNSDNCGNCELEGKTTKTNNELIETAERIVIDYANLSGRDIQHRAEFRERVDKHLQNLLSSERQRLREETQKIKERFRCASCDGAKCEHTQCCQALSDILKLLEE